MSPVHTQGSEPLTDDESIASGLRSVYTTEADAIPTTVEPALLQELENRRLIYTVGMPHGRFAHLTRKGAESIGLDPGNRK